MSAPNTNRAGTPRALDALLARRAIILLGKGGVGRTTVAGALTHFAASQGMRTLLMETDPRTPIAAGYRRKSGFRPIELADNLWTMLLDRQESVEEYLGFVVARPLLHAVFATSFYQYFVHAAPAVRELLTVGKIYHEIERRSPDLPRWDLIVVDLPASGQALSMLKMPFAARETFGNNLVGSEALEVGRFFRDRAKCAMVIVTTADHLAMTETLDIRRQLEELEIATAGVVFNRAARSRFEESDIAAMLKVGATGSQYSTMSKLEGIARSELNRRMRERRALGILRRQMSVPILSLFEEPSGPTLEVATRLANQLSVMA
ncbi:MAG TPA: ArsA family ATPase [Candidatus Binataceae bacterium]|nr:ArsA family ATPase [Candidatus Binataceae bacterium]